MKYTGQLEEQLAVDYSCSIEEIRNKETVFTRKKYMQGRRIFEGDDCILKIACYNGKLLISADDDELLEWCRKNYNGTNAAWFSEYGNLKKIDEKLRSMGHVLADFHHFYIPQDETWVPEEICKVKWYEQGEMEQFRGDARFTAALTFLETSPDMLAVTAVENEEILGMAGASADAPDMWQIGIDVTEAGRGRGLGSYLTTLIKNRILELGKLPYYGTAESHIKSQKIAVRSGFIPAWAEMYSAMNEGNTLSDIVTRHTS